MYTLDTGPLAQIAVETAELLGPAWSADASGPNPSITNNSAGLSMHLCAEDGRIRVHADYEDPELLAFRTGAVEPLWLSIAEDRGARALASAIRTRFLEELTARCAKVADYHATRARGLERRRRVIAAIKAMAPMAYEREGGRRRQIDELDLILAPVEVRGEASGTVVFRKPTADSVELDLTVPSELAVEVIRLIAPHLAATRVPAAAGHSGRAEESAGTAGKPADPDPADAELPAAAVDAVLSRLLGSATDAQEEVIRDAARAAGLWWQCTAATERAPWGCGWENTLEHARCRRCGAQRS